MTYRTTTLAAALLASVAGTASAATVAPAKPAAQIIVLDETGKLAAVDTKTGAVTIKGAAGRVLTDIAADAKGQLYGVDFENLYKLDKVTGAATLIGATGIDGTNALTFSPDGRLLAMGDGSKQLFQLDLMTGFGSNLAEVGSVSDGDLAYAGGRLFLTNWDYQLVEIGDAGRVVGDLNMEAIFGLAGIGDALYGVRGTDVVGIDLATGAARVLASFAGQGLGAAYGATVVTPLPAAALPLAGAMALLAGLRRRRRGA